MEQKREAKAEEKMEEEVEEAPVPLGTHKINILHSFFSDVEVYINNQQIYNPQKSTFTSLTIPTTLKEPSLNTKEFRTTSGTTMEIFLTRLWKHFCLIVLM